MRANKRSGASLAQEDVVERMTVRAEASGEGQKEVPRDAVACPRLGGAWSAVTGLAICARARRVEWFVSSDLMLPSPSGGRGSGRPDLVLLHSVRYRKLVDSAQKCPAPSKLLAAKPHRCGSPPACPPGATAWAGWATCLTRRTGSTGLNKILLLSCGSWAASVLDLEHRRRGSSSAFVCPGLASVLSIPNGAIRPASLRVGSGEVPMSSIRPRVWSIVRQQRRHSRKPMPKAMTIPQADVAVDKVGLETCQLGKNPK